MYICNSGGLTQNIMVNMVNDELRKISLARYINVPELFVESFPS